MPVFVAEKVGVCPDTKLLLISLRVIVTVEVAELLATTGPVPVMVEFAAVAAPAVKTTEPSALETGVTIERVFVSAANELKVQVETPEAFELEHALKIFVVPVLVAETVGVTPETKLLLPSLRVTVTAEVATPLATTGPVPVMVEFKATAAPAVKITVPSVFETGVTIERVLVSAVNEFKVQVETPEAFEREQVP